jgi:hypothetical protein
LPLGTTSKIGPAKKFVVLEERSAARTDGALLEPEVNIAHFVCL